MLEAGSRHSALGKNTCHNLKKSHNEEEHSFSVPGYFLEAIKSGIAEVNSQLVYKRGI